MENFTDAKALIEHAKETLKKIEEAYNLSIKEHRIEKVLPIEIKNFMENLRSALDFSAHGLFNKYGDQFSRNPKIYFPYAIKTKTQSQFQRDRIIERKIPGISNRPDIIQKLESYQYFNDPDNAWLPVFMELNNENKHLKLSPQIRKEQCQLTLKSGDRSLAFGLNAKVKMGKGATLKLGEMTVTGDQTFDAENPPKFEGQGHNEVTIWVSFHFASNNIEVFTLLKKALEKTEMIVNELSQI